MKKNLRNISTVNMIVNRKNNCCFSFKSFIKSHFYLDPDILENMSTHIGYYKLRSYKYRKNNSGKLKFLSLLGEIRGKKSSDLKNFCINNNYDDTLYDISHRNNKW